MIFRIQIKQLELGIQMKYWNLEFKWNIVIWNSNKVLEFGVQMKYWNLNKVLEFGNSNGILKFGIQMKY